MLEATSAAACFVYTSTGRPSLLVHTEASPLRGVLARRTPPAIVLFLGCDKIVFIDLHFVATAVILEFQLATLPSLRSVFALDRINVGIDATFERPVARLCPVHHALVVKVHNIIIGMIVEHELAIKVRLCALPLGIGDCATLDGFG